MAKVSRGLLSRISLVSVALAGLGLGPSAQAQSRPVDCTLTVKGKTYVQGVCEFRPLGNDGSFSLQGDKYFAYVNLTGKGVADGSWNADPKSTHAQAPLGELRRNGACWENAQARVCAKDLSPAQRQAIVATRPQGKMLVPEFPGLSQSCVGAAGGAWQAGARLVVHLGNDCNPTRDKAFAVSGGALQTATAAALCPSAPAAGAPVVLVACGQGAQTWRHPGTVDSAQVKTADGLCLAITQLNNDRFKGSLPIVAQPCKQSKPAAEVVTFFMSAD